MAFGLKPNYNELGDCLFATFAGRLLFVKRRNWRRCDTSTVKPERQHKCIRAETSALLVVACDCIHETPSGGCGRRTVFGPAHAGAGSNLTISFEAFLQRVALLCQ